MSEQSLCWDCAKARWAGTCFQAVAVGIDDCFSFEERPKPPGPAYAPSKELSQRLWANTPKHLRPKPPLQDTEHELANLRRQLAVVTAECDAALERERRYLEALREADWVISKLAPHEVTAIMIRGFRRAPEDVERGSHARTLIDAALKSADLCECEQAKEREMGTPLGNEIDDLRQQLAAVTEERDAALERERRYMETFGKIIVNRVGDGGLCNRRDDPDGDCSECLARAALRKSEQAKE